MRANSSHLLAMSIEVESQKLQALAGVQRARYWMRIDDLRKIEALKRYCEFFKQGLTTAQCGGPILDWATPTWSCHRGNLFALLPCRIYHGLN